MLFSKSPCHRWITSLLFSPFFEVFLFFSSLDISNLLRKLRKRFFNTFLSSSQQKLRKTVSRIPCSPTSIYNRTEVVQSIITNDVRLAITGHIQATSAEFRETTRLYIRSPKDEIGNHPVVLAHGFDNVELPKKLFHRPGLSAKLLSSSPVPGLLMSQAFPARFGPVSREAHRIFCLLLCAISRHSKDLTLSLRRP